MSEARSREAILDATRALLAEHGFAGLAVDAVAARAGVGKATIYRHWGSRAGLVADAAHTVELACADVDSGDLRTDLVEILRAIGRRVSSPAVGPLLASLVDAAERDDELAELQRVKAEERRAPLRRALRRGLERGELPAGTDVELAIDLLAGPLLYRRLLRRTRTTATDIERTVDLVLAGLAAPVRAPARR